MMIELFASLSFWFLIITFVSIATFLCFNWWQVHPLYGKNIGPPVLPLVGSFFSLARNQHRMYDWATELLRHSPSLTIRNVLFGIELYTTANPANVEHMLKTNFQNYTKGFRFQSLMQDMLGHGIFNADGELWKAQRKAASYEFTSNSLKTLMLETVQKEISDRLLPVLYAHTYNPSCNTCGSSRKICGKSCSTCGLSCKSCRTSYDGSPCHDGHSRCKQMSLTCIHQTPIDLQDIFLRFAFDNVCQISLGVDPACLNHSLQNEGFAKAFDDATELIIQRFFMPAWIWKLKRFLNVGSERKLKKALHIVHSFAMEVIRKRKEELRSHVKDVIKPHQQTDLLNRFLSVTAQMQSDSELASKVSEDKLVHTSAFGKMARERAERKSDELLRDMIISFLLAGRDTSSIALSWFFWLLILHPPVEAAIYGEIMRVVHGRKRSRNADANERNLKKDPMKEGMAKHGESVVDDLQYGAKGHAYDTDVDDGHEHDHTNVGRFVHKDSHAQHDMDAGDGHAPHMNAVKFANAHESNFSHAAYVDDGHAHDMDEGAVKDGDNTLNNGSLHNELFTYKELKEMKYLQAALQETMRLYPPVPHDTKLVVEGEVLPDGTRVRGGAQLAYHAYAMGRIKSLWGEDCSRFRPDRWFAKDGGDGELVNESPFKWPVFQAGPRTCLGKEMAMLQMKCVAAVLIERFTFSMPPAAAAADVAAPSYALSFTLKMQNGLPLLLHPRHE